MINKKYAKKKTFDEKHHNLVVCEDVENESEGANSTLNYDSKD